MAVRMTKVAGNKVHAGGREVKGEEMGGGNGNEDDQWGE